MLEIRPGPSKESPDLDQAVRACDDRGCLRSLEKVFFSLENHSPGSRRYPNVEKLNEQLLDSLVLRLRDRDYLIHVSTLLAEVERLSLQQKERKRLMSKLRQFSHLNNSDRIEVLSTLCTRGLPVEKIFGVNLGPLRAHFSFDFARFQHCMGLADAVCLSCRNLGVRVSYPTPTVVNVPKRERIFCPMSRTVLKRRNGSTWLKMTKIVHRASTKEARFRLMCHYLRVFPKRAPEKDLVKLIKVSLVDAFCVNAEQERPEGKTIPLFPDLTQRKLDKRFKSDRKNRIRFYKNLIESKSLCAPVGDDMIREAYEKHRESLCRPPEEVLRVPEEFLTKLHKYGEKVGRFVAKCYNPYRTRLPNLRATVEKPRHKGGAREALSGCRETTVGPRYLDMMNGAVRPEPYVIGLFGPPGSGKTTSIQSLVAILHQSLFSGKDREEVVYSRSCGTTHWDGYEGQPIVILDDLGQGLQDRSDLVEFEQLISVNRYQLPMASLDQKGMCFTSPIVITTSNMAFGSKIRDSSIGPVLEDDVAFWRRFHLPVLLTKPRENEPTAYQRYLPQCIMENQQRSWMEKYSSGNATHFVGWNQGSSLIDGHDRDAFLSKTFHFHELIDSIFEGFRAHTDFHENELSETWRQVITCQEVDVRQSSLPPFYEVSTEPIKVARTKRDVTVSQLFPRFPPYHPPVVEAIALPEPLKVRMITKAEAHTKCLQPLQAALFKYLRSKPQFALTHGVTWNRDNESFSERLEWIHRIEGEIQKIDDLTEENDLWLSGDYTAATDNFPMSVTNALVEGILSQIDHEPTRAWVRYEVSPHRIKYPGGKMGLQTSGQLMGSLLSFPLLCFLNDFIISDSGFKKGKYLINGDDVVAKGSLSTIRRWRENAPKVGLDLSIGKNFIDSEFCTVNSQLFWNSTVLHTGKVSCQTRYGKTLSRCYQEAQFYYGSSDELHREFIRRNLHELRSCPRSLDVPCTHGGLALEFSHRTNVDLTLAKKVYLYDFLRRFEKSLPVPGFPYIRALALPTGFFSDEELQLAGGEDLSFSSFEMLSALDLERNETEDRELTHGELKSFIERISKDDNVRSYNQLLSRHIGTFPKLGTLRSRIIYVQAGKVGFVKKRIKDLCLSLLVDFIDKGETEDPDYLGQVLIQESFEDHWIHLFDNDLISPFGVVCDQISNRENVDEDDRYQRLLPEIRTDYSTASLPMNLSDPFRELLEHQISFALDKRYLETGT